MRHFLRASIASAAALAALTPLSAALAQPAAPAAVVVDLERVFGESLAGKDAQTKLKAIATQAEQEFAPEVKAIDAEKTALAPKFTGLTEQQVSAALAKDAALATRYQALMQRLNAFEERRNLRQQEISATERDAVNQVVTAVVPDVQAVMTAKGALVSVDASSAIYRDPSVDVTTEVIARLDQRVKTVTVTKVDLTKAQQ